MGMSANGNVHVAEDRGQVMQDDKDESGRYEEMKYSGVYRENDNNNFQRGVYVQKKLGNGPANIGKITTGAPEFKPTEAAKTSQASKVSKFVTKNKKDFNGKGLMDTMLDVYFQKA
jgi:PAB1-binding protein PBP1